MTITLNNIGMIREANVKVDGLTVIAGENDTGKSTLGKALLAIIQADNIAKRKTIYNAEKEILATRLNLLFDGNITADGTISLFDKDNNEIAFAHIVKRNFVQEFRRGNNEENRFFFDATFIQSPIVFDMADFFNSIGRMKEQQKYDYDLDFDISYPYILWNLFDKISKQNPFPKSKTQQKVSEAIEAIIKGKFKLENGQFLFYKSLQDTSIKIEMANTAFGIKSFGLLQLLNENGFFHQRYCLILDEPEVHLHPSWQIKYAKIIVELVKNGIYVIVNSHSPYMVEALQRYSEIENLTNKTNFYFAENGVITQIEDSNSKTLARTFEKLSEPFNVFEEMESEKFQNG